MPGHVKISGSSIAVHATAIAESTWTTWSSTCIDCHMDYMEFNLPMAAAFKYHNTAAVYVCTVHVYQHIYCSRRRARSNDIIDAAVTIKLFSGPSNTYAYAHGHMLTQILRLDQQRLSPSALSQTDVPWPARGPGLKRLKLAYAFIALELRMRFCFLSAHALQHLQRSRAVCICIVYDPRSL